LSNRPAEASDTSSPTGRISANVIDRRRVYRDEPFPAPARSPSIVFASNFVSA
jgi:hypothetical protein